MSEQHILIIVGAVAISYGFVSALRLKGSRSWPSVKGRIVKSSGFKRGEVCSSCTKGMKRDGIHFICALSACVLLFAGCSHRDLGGQLDACRLVTKTDAESILKGTVRFDKESTGAADRLSSSPVAGSCVYTSGDDIAAPRLVIGYRLYDNAEFVKADFELAKSSMWKDQAKEVVEGVGDDAILVGGRMIVLRKGKTWLQIGVTQGEFSLDALKSVARRAGASL